MRAREVDELAGREVDGELWHRLLELLPAGVIGASSPRLYRSRPLRLPNAERPAPPAVRGAGPAGAGADPGATRHGLVLVSGVHGLLALLCLLEDVARLGSTRRLVRAEVAESCQACRSSNSSFWAWRYAAGRVALDGQALGVPPDLGLLDERRAHAREPQDVLRGAPRAARGLAGSACAHAIDRRRAGLSRTPFRNRTSQHGRGASGWPSRVVSRR